MSFVRCEKCGGVCRGGAACPEHGNPNAGEVVLTERERLVAEVERLQAQYAQVLTAWKPALDALHAYDRAHPAGGE